MVHENLIAGAGTGSGTLFRLDAMMPMKRATHATLLLRHHGCSFPETAFTPKEIVAVAVPFDYVWTQACDAQGYATMAELDTDTE